jgi:hypothetical protein
VCVLTIHDLVGIDHDGDGLRDEVVVIGTVEDCDAVVVSAVGGAGGGAAATASAEILPVGQDAFGIQPAAGERVFLARFGLTSGSSVARGRCGERELVKLRARCEGDPLCSTELNWDAEIRCERDPGPPPDGCPEIAVQTDVDEENCVDGRRLVTVVVTTDPFEPGSTAEVEFAPGDSESVPLQQLTLGGDVYGQGSVTRPLVAPESGSTTYPLDVRVGRCRADTIDVVVPACPGSTPRCPDITLEAQLDGGCDDEGNRIVHLELLFTPPHPDFVRVEFGDGREVTLNANNQAVVETDLVFHPDDLDELTVTAVVLDGELEEICRQELPLAGPLEPCGPPCPQQIHLLVGGDSDLTAAVEGGECLPPGRYVITADVEPAGQTVALTWSVDGAPASVGVAGVVAFDAASLTIELVDDNRSIAATVDGCTGVADGLDLRACRPDDEPVDEPVDEPPNQEEGLLCALLRIIGIILIALGYILTVIGLLFPPPLSLLCYVGVGLLFVGVILLLIWAFVCATDAECRILQAVINVIRAMLLLILIFGVIGLTRDPLCAALLLGNGALLGIVLGQLFLVFIRKRCVWEPGIGDLIFAVRR